MSEASATERSQAAQHSRARGAPPLVLFLCHSNTGSSIMAEAILQHLAQGRVRAASAGEIATGQANPYALECLRAHGIATKGLHSKPWGGFFGLYKPHVRFLIALRDVYAASTDWSHETSRTVVARWYMPDPATVAGSDVRIRLACEEAFGTLESRIRKFLALPLEQLTDAELSQELALFGK